jgi:hypothetical protein
MNVNDTMKTKQNKKAKGHKAARHTPTTTAVQRILR